MTVGLTEEEFENELKWAREEERERCALIAEGYTDGLHVVVTCNNIAKLIRDQQDG